MNSFSNLNRKQLKIALRNGLGRAYLYVKQNGDRKITDLIVHAMLNHLVYQNGFEGVRTFWFANIIQLSDDPTLYCDEIKKALKASEDVDQVTLLAGLAANLANRGHKSLRHFLYRRYASSVAQFSNCYAIGRALISMDGLDAFETIVDYLEKYPAKQDFDVPGVFADASGKGSRLKKKDVIAKLSELAKTRPLLQTELPKIKLAMRDLGYRYDRKRTQKYVSKPALPLESILELVEKGSRSQLEYMKFAREASSDDIDRIYSNFLKEKRPKQLCEYLKIFGNRALPKVDPKIFQLAEFGKGKVRKAANRALGQIKSDDIREFAIRMIRRVPKSINFDCLRLFEKNYLKGDHRFIRGYLKPSPDLHVTHGIVLDVLNLTDVAGKELVDCVLWAYENTPCAFCRDSAIRSLIEWRLAPKELLEECLWDSYYETRNTATAALKKLEKQKRTTRKRAEALRR